MMFTYLLTKNLQHLCFVFNVFFNISVAVCAVDPPLWSRAVRALLRVPEVGLLPFPAPQHIYTLFIHRLLH